MTTQPFEIGTRVRLLHHPQWTGEVVAVEEDGVLVTFMVDGNAITGRHSADALKRLAKEN